MKYRLTYCPPGSKVKVMEVDGGKGALQNLSSLGINLDNILTINPDSNCTGPVRVSYNDLIIPVGRELAAKIIVESDEDFKITLAKVKIGDEVEVTKINSNGDIRFRLLDMGLVRGVSLKVIRFAPLGDPIEVELKGFHLSLRMQEAESIEVKVLKFASDRGGKKRRWWSN
jgi:Fe2+ transport system protein FeoA